MNTTANAAVGLKNKEPIGSSECLVFAPAPIVIEGPDKLTPENGDLGGLNVDV